MTEEENRKQHLMGKHTINIHMILLIISAFLTGVLIFGGFGEALDFWPVLWVTLGIDAYLFGYAIDCVIDLLSVSADQGTVRISDMWVRTGIRS